ncbi:MAG: class I SAM-dependent methyltransferase [Candidatus Bathyarchaeia archaeon]|jgi:ubiquinone/menaquinone biosynthesis C-methylase UbiE
MNRRNTFTTDNLPPPGRKPYKGIAMEGLVARWYSRIQRKSVEQYVSWAKMARDRIEAGSSVLEVASGPGYLSVELAKLGNYRIVGLDISKTFVNIAKEKARAAGVQIEFRQGDAAYMPFSAGIFDFVICTSAFKNFPEPLRVLDEIFRVLKTGGKALIIDLRKDASKAGINEYIRGMKLNRFDSFFTKMIFRRMLLRSAYSKSEIQDFVSKSSFRGCEILEDEISLEISLQKQSTS